MSAASPAHCTTDRFLRGACASTAAAAAPTASPPRWACQAMNGMKNP